MVKKKTIEEAILESLFNKELDLSKKIRRDRKFKKGERNSSEEAYSMIIGILKILHPKISEKQLEDSITDAYKDGSMDAIFIPPLPKNIEIMDIKKEKFDFQKIKSTLLDIKEYIFEEGDISSLNPYVKKGILKARKKMERRQKIEILICRRGFSPPPENLKKLKKIFKDYDSLAEVNFFGGKELVQKFIEEKIVSSSIKCGVNLNSLIHRETNPSILVVKVSLFEIFKLLDKYERERLDIFERNVRGFQNKRELSKELIDSIKNSPSNFFILHNGITIVCESINKIKKTYCELENAQIINGCQTASIIMGAISKNLFEKNHLKKVFILARFYEIKEKELIEKVCQSTNTQIKIDLDDLRSNDEIQKILEKFLLLNGKKYGRKKESGKRGINKTKLAQWIYSCKFFEPADSKDKRRFLFDILSTGGVYKKIFNSSLKKEDILKIIELGEFIENKIKKIPKEKRKFEKDADLHMLAGIYFLRNNKKLTLNQKYLLIVKSIKEVIKILRKKHGKDYSYNKIFTKNKDTWKEIKKEILK